MSGYCEGIDFDGTLNPPLTAANDPCNRVRITDATGLTVCRFPQMEKKRDAAKVFKAATKIADAYNAMS